MRADARYCDYCGKKQLVPLVMIGHRFPGWIEVRSMGGGILKGDLLDFCSNGCLKKYVNEEPKPEKPNE